MSLLRIGKHGLGERYEGYFYLDEDSDRILFRLGDIVYEIQDEELNMGKFNDLTKSTADAFHKVYNSPIIISEKALIGVKIEDVDDPSLGFELVQMNPTNLEVIATERPLLYEVTDDDELYMEVISLDVE